MKEFIEKLIKKLKEKSCEIQLDGAVVASAKTIVELPDAIGAINQLAEEYGDGWIPCEKELPPQPEVNPLFDNRSVELYLVSEENADYPFRAFWNGKHFTDGFGVVDVAAWQPLPTAYRTEGE